MSYAAGEALVLAQVQACASFSSTNTSRANWKVLNKGKASTYAILRPGAFQREFIANTTVQTTWQTIVEVWERYVDDQTTMTTLQAKYQEIVDRIDAYRKLGNGAGVIQDAVVRSGGEPEAMWRNRGDGASWLRQQLVVEWKEEQTITFAE